jgi:hypothetical protein
MKREVRAMVAIRPINFPDELEIRFYPLARKGSSTSAKFFIKNSHHTWDWVRNQYPVSKEAFEKVEGYLRAGELANLISGDMELDLPDDAEWPTDER